MKPVGIISNDRKSGKPSLDGFEITTEVYIETSYTRPNIDVYRSKIPHYLQVLMDLNNAISEFLSR